LLAELGVKHDVFIDRFQEENTVSRLHPQAERLVESLELCAHETLFEVGVVLADTFEENGVLVKNHSALELDSILVVYNLASFATGALDGLSCLGSGWEHVLRLL